MSYEKYSGKIEESKIFTREHSSEICKNLMKVSVKCPTRDFDWKGFVISYNYKVEQDREDYFVEPVYRKAGKKVTRIDLELDLRKFPFRMTHWTVFAVYEKGNVLFTAPVMVKKRKIKLLEFLFKRDSFRPENGYIAFFYTRREGILGIRYREASPYDNGITRWKETAAYLIYLMRKTKLKKRGIYLIYEKRCQKAQDNGYHLFRYCMENDMEAFLGRKIYYVIEKKAPDRKKLHGYRSNVIGFMSMKHMIYLQVCNLLISSDSRAHAYIWQNQKSLIAGRLRKKPHVFLGHGVLAFKRLNDSFLAKNMRSVMCTATSKAEKQVIVNELGFRNSQVPVTGYARFDALRDKSKDHREILLMPTHRSWLFEVERDVFLNSEYYRRYRSILNSGHLIDQLEKHDLILNFYLHPSIGEHVETFTGGSERVKIIPYDQYALDDLMMRCKLLITDYSSVAWDVHYMDKPILFYQYDTKEYIETWGSYVDLEKDLPGERVTEEEELLKAIDKYIENGFVSEYRLLSERAREYEFSGQGNARRICEELRAGNY